MKNKNLSARFIGKFSSIQSVIFATVAVLVLSAVVIVTGVSMKFTNTSIFENSSEYTHTIIQQMNQNIDSYIDYMENIAYLISSNEDVQDYLFDEKIDNEGRYRILNQFQTILDSRSDIRNVGIISKNGRMLINDGSKSVNQDLDLNTQEWYATALEKPNGPILTSSHVQHIISGERPWVITLSRGIRDRSGSGEKEGVFFIDLNYSAISGLCDQSTVGTKGYAFILDAKGNIVYHPQQQQLYNELQTENISLIMDTDEDTVLTGTGNDGKLYSISRSEKTGWTVVDCTNVKELLSKSRQAQSVYVLTAIILVIVALLFSRFMARSITLPIQKLRDSMKKVQEGDFSVSDVVVDSKNEIGSLTKSFDVMTHRIHELMEQNVHEQEEKRKSELKALQSQINPHFLYNTLDSIIWMAESGKNEEVVQMTSALAKLLRQSISNEDEIVTVEREIEYTRNYLAIQKLRYRDQLEYIIDIDEEVLHRKIVKLVIQPLVENAIVHGMPADSRRIVITLKCRQEDGLLILSVTDNGIGIAPERLHEIQCALNGSGTGNIRSGKNGIGVVNVHQRIQLMYGEACGLRFISCEGLGTSVEVRIPARQDALGGW